MSDETPKKPERGGGKKRPPRRRNPHPKAKRHNSRNSRKPRNEKPENAENPRSPQEENAKSHPRSRRRPKKKHNRAHSSQRSAPDYERKIKAFEGQQKRRHSNPKKSENREPSSVLVKEERIRINRFLAQTGISSRREAEKHIRSGKVTVNGKVMRDLSYRVKDGDTVKFKGRTLMREKPVYVLLNKPKDFITTTDDPQERKTVMQLVGAACEERIYPVGRLDRATTGLLLFTNDGDLAKHLTHPSHGVQKIYKVELNKPLTPEVMAQIQEGFDLEDGPVRVKNMAILSEDAQTLGLEIKMGRNRIVRRIFEHFNYEVVKLDRTGFAGLTKERLPRGKWRFLTEREVIRLKFFTGKQ